MVTQALWFRKIFKVNHQYFNTKEIFPSGEEWTFIWTNLKHWMICPRMQFTQGRFLRSLFDIGPVVKLAMYIHNVAIISPCNWVFSVNFTWLLCANSSLVEIQSALVLWMKIRMWKVYKNNYHKQLNIDRQLKSFEQKANLSLLLRWVKHYLDISSPPHNNRHKLKLHGGKGRKLRQSACNKWPWPLHL